jgi:integrating conjugative element protein (TIGR03749 family)
MKYLLLFLGLFACSGEATQIIEWQKKPISVVLPIGKERILQLPDNVFVGVPANIKPLMRVQSAQGFVYLTALEEFYETRIQLKLNKTGEIIVLDIKSTNEAGTAEDIIIKLAGTPQKETSNNNKEYQTKQRETSRVTPIQLTRFAARMFYGPDRLALNDNRIRVTKSPIIELSGLFTGASYNLFDMEAKAVFKTGNLYLTAVLLKNKSLIPQTIRFKDINADFKFATPQHIQLNQRDVAGDITMLYIITDKPLEASLYLTNIAGVTHGR